MKILVCYDGSDPSKRAIEKAHQLTADCGIHEVTLLHAHQAAANLPTSADGFAPTEENLSTLKKAEAENVQQEKEFLLEQAKTFDDTGAALEVKLLEGPAAKVITEIAEKDGYDLIIMGSRGLGGIRQAVLGSVSNAVIQQTKISVMVVK